MVYKKYIYSIFFIFYFHFTFSSSPKTYKEFKNNCLRLVNNKQYTFLSHYFKKNALLFKQNPLIGNLGLLLVNKTSLSSSKTTIYKTLLQLKKYLNSKNKSQLYFEIGQLSFFHGKWSETINFLSKSEKTQKYYYLGKSYLAIEKYQEAMINLLEFKKRINNNHLLFHSMWLSIAQVHYIQKNYEKSYTALLEIKTPLVEKIILFHKIFTQTKEKKKANEIINLLKKNYPYSIQSNQYLKEINQ